MPLPIVPILSALAAGGSLVPHAAGGMIVTSTSGYVAGTYLSTQAIAALLTTAGATLGAGVVSLSGVTASVVGSAGVFGTTVGSSGVTGLLMSLGIVSSTPVWVPAVAGGVAVSATIGLGISAHKIMKLKKRLTCHEPGTELYFTEADARALELMIKRLPRSKPPY